MCGLVGVIGTNLSFQANKAFKQLLYIDSLRGPHSTGIAMNTIDNEVLTYKRALASADFLQLNTPNNMLMKVTGEFLMGHNRYATQGAINDDNAHPFTYGNVTLAHNGTLTDQSTLPDHKEFAVDSENIAYAMGLVDDPEEVISKLKGAFALTWYNDFEMKFYIVRNSERPMWIAKAKTTDTYYYASERYMLEMVLTRNSITYDIKELPVGKLLTLDLSFSDIVETYTTVKLAPKPKPRVNYGYNSTRPQGNYPSHSDSNISNYYQNQIKLLANHKLKVGDTLEFYSQGLPDLLPSNLLGILVGRATQDAPLYVKAFSQPNDSLAGYYKGRVQSIAKENGVDTVVLLRPELVEIIEDDVNNQGKGNQVSAIMAKMEDSLATKG